MKLFNYIGDLLGGSPDDYSEPTFSVIEDSDLGNTTEISCSPNSITDTNIPCGLYNSCFFTSYLNGVEIDVVGVVDPTNVSTLDNNLTNDNFTDLCYNNSSAGSANKPSPAINLGASPPQTGVVRVHWWTNASYTSNNYNIQGSNDGVNFTDVVTGLDATGLHGQFVDVPVNTNYQYWRVFCVSSNNPTYFVISELEAFEVGQEVLISESDNEELSISCNNSGNIQIINNSNLTLETKINHNL